MDEHVSKQTPTTMCHTVLCPGQERGLCQLPSEKHRESSKLAGTETREPCQVMKVFEYPSGMLGLDPVPWGASGGFYVEKDTIRFAKWLVSGVNVLSPGTGPTLGQGPASRAVTSARRGGFSSAY